MALLSMNGGTTALGYRNRNGQVVQTATGRRATDHLQDVYMLRCEKCDTDYGTNGTEIWNRKCPTCQGGKPGIWIAN